MGIKATQAELPPGTVIGPAVKLPGAKAWDRGPVRLHLPYPPSLNHYWRHVGSKVLISSQGREYRKAVATCVVLQGAGTVDGRLAVTIYVRSPDRRRRDLDNLCKGLLDALAHASVYEDDSQIDRLVVERQGVSLGGSVLVVIEAAKLGGY